VLTQAGRLLVWRRKDAASREARYFAARVGQCAGAREGDANHKAASLRDLRVDSAVYMPRLRPPDALTSRS